MKKVTRPLEFDSISSHRKEDCARYAACLSEASALLWQSFSCCECQHYCPTNVEQLSYEKACSPLAWEV